MEIGGLQKLTLLDYPGRVACTVFTKGCNFRCPFCQNGDLVLPCGTSLAIETEELFAFLKRRRRVLDGVCISGGEPLMNQACIQLIADIKKLGYDIKVDTNGSFPKRLRGLAERGLIDYVAMDIKNSPENYGKTVGIPEFRLDSIQESIDFLLSGRIPYEFRTTVVKEFHGKEDFMAIGQWIKGADQYFLQGFEDSEYVIQRGLHSYTKEKMMQFQNVLIHTIPNTKIRGMEL